MAQRTSYECAHSGLSTLEFEDITDERLQLDAGAYTALPTAATDEHASEAPNSIDLGQSDITFSFNQVEGETKQGESVITATLERNAYHEWISTIFDVFLSLIPLFFLVIAILCLCLNNKPVSAYGQSIKAITSLSPTLFPIVYAAILGKLLRRIALFKAERSSTIGTLEQLIGSQSFFASIERQFGLRRINLLGFAIIAAWVLSPLGGQSSLRLLSTRPFIEAINDTVQYQSVEGFGERTLFHVHMAEDSWTYFAPPFMTALQSAPKYAREPRDLFGDLRIPDITSVVPDNVSSRNAFGWHALQDTSNLAYTSLVGIPVVDIPTSGNATFTLESSYWEIHCEPFAPGASFLRNKSMSDPYESKLDASPHGPSFMLKSYGLRNDDDTRRTGNNYVFRFTYSTKIDYMKFINSGTSVMTANCTASFRLVESGVDCEEGDCRVQRMRHSKRHMSHIFRQMKGDEYDFKSNWIWYFDCLCRFLGGTSRGSGQSKKSSELPELWMANPDSVLGPSSSTWDYVNLSKLPPEVFSRRLQVVMNTFWDATVNSTYQTGNLTSQGLGQLTNSSAWNTTNVVGGRYHGDQYICNTIFVTLTMVISWLLFIAAGISVVLGTVTMVPDTLGYVSTLARDDPYFGKHVPSHLDGLEATRILRDVRVILGDVRREAEIGHVAFASMEIGPRRVSRKRLYD